MNVIACIEDLLGLTQNGKLLTTMYIEAAGWMRLSEAFRANRRIQLAASF
ncbi:hypothetical protein LPB67_09835 [Undibacterium sp. Jales W-56]|nr:hypothetical protein [Undibacterium sp. Jales W-56]MCU6434066.1 hypothetical protein [Undibacterium sp. Jales W-56]